MRCRTLVRPLADCRAVGRRRSPGKSGRLARRVRPAFPWPRIILYKVELRYQPRNPVWWRYRLYGVFRSRDAPYPQRKIIGPTFFRMKYGTRQRRIPLDIVDKKTRSRIMSRIRGQDTKPEIALRKSLHARGFRYRTHARDLPGKPDLVFPRFRAIVLVHGCFWHRHLDCRLATTPASNVEFWQRKFQRTVERDQRVLAELLENGWRVATVWECALGKRDLHLASSQLEQWLKSDELQKEIPFSGAHC